MNWEFALPVKIIFGVGKRKNIAEYIAEIGGTNGVLVCGQSFVKNGTADEFVKNSNGRITAVFSDIRPNPTTDNVNDCVSLLKKRVLILPWRSAAAHLWTAARQHAQLQKELIKLKHTTAEAIRFRQKRQSR